ncbi:MAG: ABC transporter ATP-binding protein [Terricaulis sp.]|nr:ABC transporter ATP-binding protein [Terricaulis sp.]
MKHDPESFWALRDINFEVARGEVLGVIGHNGAGKTTLLRILNGEMGVDAGRARINGQRSSLIDLTGGFSRSMTGRENIYFRGAHLGFDREFLRRTEDEIIAFAELDEFIDAPIKTYSSGMLMRLGFAVTVFAQPDVLIIDEILSVGDFLFQQKCMNKVNQLRERAAVVMVSHSMSAITQMADRVLLLDRGAPVFLGDPVEAVKAYYQLEEAKQLLGARLSRHAGGAPPEEAASAPIPDWPDFGTLPDAPAAANKSASAPKRAAPKLDFPAKAKQPDTIIAPDTLPVLVRKSMNRFVQNTDSLADVTHRWLDEKGRLARALKGGGHVDLEISFTLKRFVRRLVIGAPIWSSEGVLVTAFGTQGRFAPENLEPGRYNFRLRVPSLKLNKGAYYPLLAILDGAEYMHRWPMAPFDVSSNPAPLAWGLVTLDYHWERGEAADAEKPAVGAGKY